MEEVKHHPRGKFSKSRRCAGLSSITSQKSITSSQVTTQKSSYSEECYNKCKHRHRGCDNKRKCRHFKKVTTKNLKVKCNGTFCNGVDIAGDLTVNGSIINPGFIALQDEYNGIPNSGQVETVYGEKYPVEDAVAPVFLSLIAGESRLPPSLSGLRVSNADIQAAAGTVYRNCTDECWLAVNPTNTQNMAFTTHQDRWSGAPFIFGGIFLANMIAYTNDAGNTWQESEVVLSKCQGPTLPWANNDWDSASDPHVAFDYDGSAYQTSLGFNTLNNFEQAVELVKSTDGGSSFNKPQTTWREDGDVHFSERQNLSADPTRPNTLYLVWEDELSLTTGGDSLVVFQRSTDAGSTWTAPLEIMKFPSDPAVPFPWGAILKVLTDGTLVVTCGNVDDDLFDNPLTPVDFGVSRSIDGGDTWSFSIISTFPIGYVVDPDDPVLAIYGQSAALDTEINPVTDQLYAVYQTYRSGANTSEIITSTDGGLTWSAPIEISSGAFLPSVAVASDGVVGVMFSDFRNHSANNPATDALETDIWLKLYSADLTTVISETRLTPISFDFRQAMRRTEDWLYLADYFCLTNDPSNNDFVGSFTLTNPPYGIGVTPPPSLDGLVFDNRNRQSSIFIRFSR